MTDSADNALSSAARKPGSAIAIVGMAGRFPGARNLAEFWRNLRDGIESLERFSDEEILAAGVDPELLANPAYVKAGSCLERAEEFDAAFFGVNPREAEVTDPQHRIFLECAWEALEDAGYDVERLGVPVGVFAGASMNTYLFANLLANPGVLADVGNYQAMICNDKDFLATRVSYRLNLRGPSLTIQTACSTSLVAVHVACESLLTYQCDLALAGGVSISFPRRAGYLYQEGMIFSPDGKVRPFDARGRGIRAGEGAGIVVLKRLDDALAAGDSIRAVILGTAINNDGAQKIGYTAPSVEGQAEAIAAAQSIADVDPSTITYIETHGTATPLGDPIEIAALTQVFRTHTQERQFCAIGSVKSNLGHLDAAAGIAGLIKTVLALEHGEIPPSLNFETPNPQIDFATSPFFVNTALRPWTNDRAPRRAGVSSFGIGGTNAHVVLEEAPALTRRQGQPSEQLIVLSARTPAALDEASRRLADFIANRQDVDLGDIAYTLQTGRRVFDCRRILVATDATAAARALESGRGAIDGHGGPEKISVVFMFSGQGSQYPGMAWELYRSESVFRKTVEYCAAALVDTLGLDLRAAIFPQLAGELGLKPIDPARIHDTQLTQPVLFTVEYALAKLWEYWGVVPEAMIGHSIGEYVAACLAGVFTLESALALVAARGALMQSMTPGAMLSVPLGEAAVASWLDENLALTAINAPDSCVVSGPVAAIESLERKLDAAGIGGRRLRTSHAFHSPMMEPAVGPFVALVADHTLSPPRVPIVSNVSGTWITADEATDPAYWGRQLRGAVRFADGIRMLAAERQRLFIEVGPGKTLSTLARQCLDGLAHGEVIATLPHPQERVSDRAFALEALGRAWLAGAPVHWEAVHEGRSRRRVSLPTYPFEGRRYSVAPNRTWARRRVSEASARRAAEINDWFWLPSWQRSAALPAMPRGHVPGRWLVFADDSPACAALLRELAAHGVHLTSVMRGESFCAEGAVYRVAPENREDYDRLMQSVLASGEPLSCVLHLWNASPSYSDVIDPQRGRVDGFYSLLFLAQAFGDAGSTAEVTVLAISADMQSVLGSERVRPERSLLLGPVLVMSQDVPGLRARSIDVTASEWQPERAGMLAAALVAETSKGFNERVVAYRQGFRWIWDSSPLRLEAANEGAVPLRNRGVYLITGGTGGIGLTIARHLARTASARLVLTARTPIPEAAQREAVLRDPAADDATKARIRAVRDLEALGGEVLVAAADVADEAQMRAVLDAVAARFGELNGVVHAAGLPGIGVLPLKTREKVEAVLRPKVEGTLLLDRLLAGAQLDFLVLCSSINTAFGWHGTTDYSSANAFLDAFAESGAARCTRRVITINWGTWREVGMAASLAAGRSDGESGAMLAAIEPDEGVEALRRVLASGLTRVFVTPRPMPDLLAESEILLFAARASERGEAAKMPPALKSSTHARPDLDTDYVAPRDDEEETLAAIWSQLLGIEPVGVHDNFFDLGGHSVLATRVLARVHDAFKVRLPMRAIFDGPTVSELAVHVRSAIGTRGVVTAENSVVDNREEIEL